jgi:hypothetical protein
VEGNDALLLIDFVNLKIKSTQSFKDTHRGRVYVSDHTCISTFVLCFSNKRSIDKKNSFSTQSRQSIKAHLKVGGRKALSKSAFLVTDFVNLKIKSTQFFKGAHRGRVCVHVFIRMSDHTRIFLLCF